MKKIRNILTVTKYDILLFLRYPINVVWLILAPFVFSLVGVLLVYLVGFDRFNMYMGGDQSGLLYVLCGYAVFSISNYSWQCNGKIESEMTMGTAKMNFLQPISKLSYIYGICLGTIATTGILSLAILFLLIVLNHLSLVGAIFSLTALVLAMIQFLGISLIISSISIRYKRIGGLTSILTFALQIITGMMIPIRIFPEAVQAALIRMPTSVAIDCIRSMILGLEPLQSWSKEIFLLTFYAVILNICGSILCNNALKVAKKNGSIDVY